MKNTNTIYTKTSEYHEQIVKLENKYNEEISPLIKQIDKVNDLHSKNLQIIDKEYQKKFSKHNEKLVSFQCDYEQKVEKAKESFNQKNDFINQNLKNLEVKNEKFLTKEIEKFNKIYDNYDIYKTKINTQYEENVKDLNETYDKNVSVFRKKLDKYNENFDKLMNTSKKNSEFKLNEVIKKIDDTDKEISYYSSLLNTEMDKTIIQCEERVNNHQQKQKRFIVMQNKAYQNQIKTINEYIFDLQNQIKEKQNIYLKYSDYKISDYSSKIEVLKSDFSSWKETTLENNTSNLKKLDLSLDGLSKRKNKKRFKEVFLNKKIIEAKVDAAIKIKEISLKQEIKFFEDLIDQLKKDSVKEIQNIKILFSHLISYQEQKIKVFASLKKHNIEFSKLLLINDNLFEESIIKEAKITNQLDYELRRTHDHVRVSQYNRGMENAKSIFEVNLSIDNHSKELDCLEPNQKILINNLKKELELLHIDGKLKSDQSKVYLEESKERQNYENNLLINEINYNNSILDLEKKKTISQKVLQNNFDILKASRIKKEAKEHYMLKVASLLRTKKKNSFEYKKNIDLTELNRQNELINTKKSIDFKIFDIKNDIMNLNQKLDYKVEIINKFLEEELSKSKEQLNRAKLNFDNTTSEIETSLSKEIDELRNQISDHKIRLDNNINKINMALEREIKIPKTNLFALNKEIREKEEIIVKTLEIKIDELKRSSIYISTLSENDLKDYLKYLNSNNELTSSFKMFIDPIFSFRISTLEYLKTTNKLTTNNPIHRKKRVKNLSKLDFDYDLEFQRIAKEKEDYLKLFNKKLNTFFLKIRKIKSKNFELTKKNIVSFHSSITNILTKIANQTVKDIKKLYQPLLIPEKDFIENANDNSIKAISLAKDNYNSNIKPILNKIEEIKNNAKQTIENNKQNLDENVSILEKKIEDLVSDASENKAKEEKITLENIKTLETSLLSIADNKQLLIDDVNKNFDSKIIFLNKDNEEKVSKTENSLKEAEKILDYEIKIQDISIETTKSKYEELKVQIENEYLNKISLENEKIEQMKADFRINIEKENNNFQDNIAKINRDILSKKPSIEAKIKSLTTNSNYRKDSLDSKMSSLKEQYFSLQKKAKDKLSEDLVKFNDDLVLYFTNYKEKYSLSDNQLVGLLKENYNIIDDEFNATLDNIKQINLDSQSKVNNRIKSINEETKKLLK